MARWRGDITVIGRFIPSDARWCLDVLRYAPPTAVPDAREVHSSLVAWCRTRTRLHLSAAGGRAHGGAGSQAPTSKLGFANTEVAPARARTRGPPQGCRAKRHRSLNRPCGVAMYHNLGMGSFWMRLDRSPVWIVASDGSKIWASRIVLGDVGDDGELGDAPASPVGLVSEELASRNPGGPLRRAEMVVVALRVRQAWFVVLELPLPVVVQKPVEQLLVVFAAVSQQSARAPKSRRQ